MIQSLNFIYPNISFDNNENFNYKLLYGKKGLLNIMDTKDNRGFAEYEYKEEIIEEYGRIFSSNE